MRMTFAEQLASLRRTVRRHLSERLGGRTSRPITQLLALKAISEGVRNQGSLAERLMVDAPAASRLVERLAEDGLVRRMAGEDRRCVRLELTPEGEVELGLLRETLRELDGELLQYLPEAELAELQRLMAKLQRGLAAHPQGTVEPGSSEGCGGD
ncbi:MarR family transcriptional regulator [Myxococcus sp. K15C18031901]|uniref:MarR family winged helix-turn-helix transcriptional regulator n=1 Tax=Myxococcus dinghuensis TaxID=2906761 RepID=UPI0020A749E8|nr:MarR family transcriptional regulator [Myxococcus dinghuensis]MCP3100073.1 MarR family transcriptional regulator [Myxococcus dinghuensis]